MDLNNIEINVDTVVYELTQRIAKLERERAVLIAQQEALVKQLGGEVGEAS